MHFLFVKESLAWPRASGHDVHTYYLMRSLAEAGHVVSLTARTEPSPEALDGLALATNHLWDAGETEAQLLRGWQERFRSYWGIENAAIHSIADQAEQCAADVVVAVGLEALPLLAGVRHATRVWYAADEWVWHHLSFVRPTQPRTWSHLRAAAIKGLYEFTFRTVVDRAWVVSPADRQAMQWIAGIENVDVLPNGVDPEHYAPQALPEAPNSCMFWGRLDFEPNIQALEWFCDTVWPRVLAQVPQAQFQILGFAPVPAVQRLARRQGVALAENLPDLRDAIGRRQVVVIPMQSGGGIKNKLLEAAAMARPIICSPRACNGLNLDSGCPLQVAKNPQQWVDGLLSLWESKARRVVLGQAARNWVTQAHSWQTTAEIASKSLSPYMTKKLPVV